MKPVTEITFESALAHQLRTPISALRASSTNLRRNLRGLLEDLSMLTSTHSALDQRQAATRMTAFLARVIDESSPPPITGLLPRDRLDVIVLRLQESGLRGDLTSIASSLLRGGWDTYMEEISPMLGAEPGVALNLLDAVSRVRASLHIIEISLARVEGLSATLRTLTCAFEVEPVDLAIGLEETAAMLREGAGPAACIRVRVATPPRVAAHGALLREVWSALLTNAVQAAGPEGTVLVEAQEEGGEARGVVTVTDDGPGIPPDIADRIFEPSFTTRAADGGTGLGLPLARRIVARMGGTLTVASRPGRTCFTVSLPAVQAARAAGE